MQADEFSRVQCLKRRIEEMQADGFLRVFLTFPHAQGIGTLSGHKFGILGQMGICTNKKPELFQAEDQKDEGIMGDLLFEVPLRVFLKSEK